MKKRRMNEDFLMFFPNVTPQKLFRPRNLAIEVGLRITIRCQDVIGVTGYHPTTCYKKFIQQHVYKKSSNFNTKQLNFGFF